MKVVMKKRKALLILLTLLVISVGLVINVMIANNRPIVCIDAGHGGTDVGAVLKDRYEKDDTLKVAKLVERELKKQKIKVIMTRKKDKTISLEDRCKIANQKRADMFVSIHRNSATSGNGIEIWVNSKKDDKEIELANSILQKIEKTNISNNRGVKYGTIGGEDTDYYVLKNTQMPSCLIELGFITNQKDNDLLDKNIKNYAKAIADGIIEQLNQLEENDSSAGE